jgi:hypothetical protein
LPVTLFAFRSPSIFLLEVRYGSRLIISVVNKLKRAENSLLQPSFFLHLVRREVLQQQEQAVFPFILDARTKHVLLINSCLQK